MTETPGQAAERVFKATGDWDEAAQAAVQATTSSFLALVGVSMDEVIAAVTEATKPVPGDIA